MDNSIEKEIKRLIEGFGVLAETTKLAYESFVKSGFSKEDALYLAGEVMLKILEESMGSR